MSDIKRLRAKKAKLSGGVTGEVIDFTSEIENPVNDRVPDAVWDMMQQAGVEATHRLAEMLEPHRFDKMQPKDQMRLISMAQDRAFGRPDAGVKRSVSVNISAGDDAVAASLSRLDAARDLPEYRAQSGGPSDPAKSDTNGEHDFL